MGGQLNIIALAISVFYISISVLIVGAKIQHFFCLAKLFHRLKVAGGVLAPGADEVGGELVAFVDVAADFADPLLFV